MHSQSNAAVTWGTTTRNARPLTEASDQPEMRFIWIDEILPAGSWSKALRHRVTVTMWQVGWAVVNSGEFEPLEVLYRDFVSIYPRLLVEADDADYGAHLYTVMHIMLWRRTQRLSELLPFNTEVVQPFVAFLDRHFAKSTPREAVREVPRIAYLSETSDLFGANAAARVTVSLMLGQQELRAHEDRPILYCLNKPAADLLEFAACHRLEIRDVARSSPSLTADAVLAQLRADDVDVLIADSNCAVATMVMQRRPVPVQAFHENGFATWSIPELDLALLGITKPLPHLFADHVVMVQTPRNTAQLFQKVERPKGNIDGVRAYLRSESGIENPTTIYGFYGRMAKVTADYMALIEAILMRDLQAIFFAGGTGVCLIVEACKRTSPVGDRIILHKGFVDGHIVAECIDVFLDTFPFPGGMSCIEVQARGVPVVWMDSDDLPAIIAEHRDPALLARNLNEFVERAVSLIDPVVRTTAGSIALQIADRFSDMTGQAKEVEDHLRRTWDNTRSCRLRDSAKPSQI